MLNATAGASVGAVGTYAFMRRDQAAMTPGATTAGSNLKYTSAAASVSGSNPTPSGTWRLMGYIENNYYDAKQGISLFLRIS